jgi:hypothetical protein
VSAATVIRDIYHSSLMMEAARTSETSVDNYFTRQYIPEDNSELHTRRRENLKSHTVEAQLADSDSSSGNTCDMCLPHDGKVLKNVYSEVTIKNDTKGRFFLLLQISTEFSYYVKINCFQFVKIYNHSNKSDNSVQT